MTILIPPNPTLEQLVQVVEAVIAALDGDVFVQKTFVSPDVDSVPVTIVVPNNQQGDAMVVLVGGTNRTFSLNDDGEVRARPVSGSSVAMRVQAYFTGQTANLFEVASSTGVDKWFYVDAAHRARADNLGHVHQFQIPGALTVTSGAFRIYNDTGLQLGIRGVRASVGTAPTGAAVIVDVNKNGVSLFTTQANRPTIVAGTNTSGLVSNMEIVTIENGEYLSVDVDQIGSTLAGADLMVQVLTH